ncbi:MAG: MFS transporter [Candidatus Nanohaloarchaea archaeon]|nr:MFS transporter [Candidatus Nanohaloarchaea archaeon]
MRYRSHLPLVSANLIRMVYVLGSSIVLQLYLKELGASPFQVSLLVVIFWAAMLLFAPLWGALSDASGRRKVFLAVSVLGAALVFPVIAATTTVAGVLGLRFLYAVLAVGFPPVALATMSTSAAAGHRGKSLAPYHTSRAMGFLIGWGGAGLLLDAAGFTVTFTVLAGVGIVGFIVTLFITGVDTPNPVTLGEVWEKARHRWIPSPGDGSLRRHGLHYLLAAIFLRKAAFIGFFSLIAVYAVDVLGISASLLGLILAVNPVTQLLFIDLFGTVADRHGRRRVLLFGFLTSVPVPFMLIYAGNPAVFAAAYGLLGVSFAALVQGSTAFIGDVAPDGRHGEFMGLRKSAQGVAGVVGPLLAGWLATVYGYRAMLLAMGALTVLGAVVAWTGTDETLDEMEPHVSVWRDVYDTFSFLHR